MKKLAAGIITVIFISAIYNMMAIGAEIQPIENTGYYLMSDDAVYICNEKGDIIIDQKFYSVEETGNGFIVRYYGNENNNLCAILNNNLELVTEVKYSNIKYNENTESYECYYDSNNKSCVDFFDREFNSIRQPTDLAEIENTEYYCLRIVDENNSVNEYYFICDEAGNRLVDEGFRKVEGVKGNILVTRFADYKMGIYDKNLNLKVNIGEYDLIYFDESINMYTLVKYGTDDIGNNTSVVEYVNVDLEKDNPLRRLDNSDYYISENDDGTYYICDENGSILINKKYYSVKALEKGFIVVRSSDSYPYKYGLLNAELESITDEKYYNIWYKREYLHCLNNDNEEIYDENLNFIESKELGYKYVSPIEGMEGRYIYNVNPKDDMPRGNEILIDDNGNPLTKWYLSISKEVQPGNTLIISERIGMADSIQGLLNYDLETIIPLGSYPVEAREENGVAYGIAGYDEEAVYYDMEGNRYGSKNELFRVVKSNGELSSWAEETVNNAIAIGIVPESLQSLYNKNITRLEFCMLAMRAYEVKTGISITKDQTTPFDDVSDDYVTAAYNMGIVAGVEYRKFAPDNSITRQEAAVMLNNLADVLGIENSESIERFADESFFAQWAIEEIYNIASIKSGDTYVMAGTGEGKFSPWMNYTREQAIVTVYRLISV